MATLIKVGSGGKVVATAEALTELGFRNVPEGVWEMNTSADGANPTLDHATVIPLIGYAWGHARASNTDGTATANAKCSINSRRILYLGGQKRNISGKAGDGNCVNATDAHAVYYPYFYDNDLTAVMTNLNYTGGNAAQQQEDRSSAVYQLHAWLVKVG